LFKWALICAGLAVFIGTPLAIVFTPLLSTWVVQWFTYDLHFKRVQITATHDRKQCSDAASPIVVAIKNGSSRTALESSFYLNAVRPGRSFDVSNGGEWTGRPIPPGETLKICAPAVLIKDAAGENPQDFVWSAGLSWVRFAD
jgi:hypothetical protein